MQIKLKHLSTKEECEFSKKQFKFLKTYLNATGLGIESIFEIIEKESKKGPKETAQNPCNPPAAQPQDQKVADKEEIVY